MDGRARLAWNVRRLRTAGGLSQEKLALDAGVAGPYLSRIERGVVNPTIDVMDRLATAFGVPVDALLRARDAGEAAPEPLRAGRKPRKGQ
ncbi:MAG TPA: helix-turn-helix transcriptional regulator [Mesorhizobium sp.]|jgi:transcriptional regulator with XRE-family HTH domain|nr:helix-turn-helix transcriptional regulator [Mesorhizobium sp.]